MIKCNNPYFTALLAVLILSASACNETEADLTEAPLATYYPLVLDRATYYSVDSIVLVGTVGGTRYDTSRSEAREVLVDTFRAPDGRLVYRGERSTRGTAADDFTFDQTYTLEQSGSGIVRTEDNLAFTKLVSPVREGERWDGNNAFDDLRRVPVGGEFLDVYRAWDYRYANLDSTVNLAGTGEFGNVLVVRQAQYSTEIDLRNAYELYAPGIGLLERYLDARHTQCIICCNRDGTACRELSWDEKAEKGYIIHQRYLRQD